MVNSKPHNIYPLVSKKNINHCSVISIGDEKIGARDWSIIAGPCSIESYEHAYETIKYLTGKGIKIIRGGIYKPRKSPYDFQGLRENGIEIIKQLKEKFDFYFISEILSPEHIELLEPIIDIWQVGARSMANYELLKHLSVSSKPVLLKRGIMATIEEWLLAAEYLLQGGNENVILCERGIRSFEPMTRFTFDINAIPIVKDISHLPIIADPSHAVGKRNWVPPLAKAALISGADGIMVEVHPEPDKALSDSEQSISFEQFNKLLDEIASLKKCSINYKTS
ncbi:MAG: 3-deoxy-7-phosphoheptulonate synthase [Calditrichia bacterium]|nr:3-deoxy-7-phosphoheptulonate synthase [Calditrichia bacterium]